MDMIRTGPEKIISLFIVSGQNKQFGTVRKQIITIDINLKFATLLV